MKTRRSERKNTQPTEKKMILAGTNAKMIALGTVQVTTESITHRHNPSGLYWKSVPCFPLHNTQLSLQKAIWTDSKSSAVYVCAFERPFISMTYIRRPFPFPVMAVGRPDKPEPNAKPHPM